MKLTKQRLIEIVKEEYQKILNEKTIRLPDMDVNFKGNDMAQLLGYKGRLAINKMDAKGLLYAIQKEFSIYQDKIMKITRSQLKEIIREELVTLNEKTIKTKSGLKVELTRKNKYELVRIYGHKGYVEVYGRKDIKNFVEVLKKNFRIVQGINDEVN